MDLFQHTRGFTDEHWLDGNRMYTECPARFAPRSHHSTRLGVLLLIKIFLLLFIEPCDAQGVLWSWVHSGPRYFSCHIDMRPPNSVLVSDVSGLFHVWLYTNGSLNLF